MNLRKLFNFTLVLGVFSAKALSADTLIDSEKFNVYLNLAPAHYLTVSDLDFGYVNPITISEDSKILESTTGSLIAYSNSASGHYVQIVASEKVYLSDDGLAFLMRGTSGDNHDAIPFILKSSQNPDGSDASNGIKDIFPGDMIVAVDASDENQKSVRNLWAALVDNKYLKTVAADKYLAVLTANHYSNN